MGKAGFRHSKTERAGSRREMPWDGDDRLTQRATFFFDLELLLPPGLEAREVNRARQAVERRLQRMVRKKDRIVWTANGFYLLIASVDVEHALAAAERVRQDIVGELGDQRMTPAPNDGAAVRMALPEELERVSLMCA